ncbi:leucine-rich repeat domain-containing protein [Anaerocolumna sp. AGMB13020]|uniref:leucine-rich repeat domain-containing protein n=1 Tax=Anaerocolumna sp. AGMB13020 TaxID=3081750 RepID=UPI0029547CA5|nr:leucine-rich repeat domain-containing protein [Anaerocolumna sp. AGMB13020]WOO37864.1 leucine-rich repeat domain-containing protein [Anaerocolumna sp. AGMB13020]
MNRNIVKLLKYLLGVIAILFFIMICPGNRVKADSEEDFIIKDGVLMEYIGDAKHVVIPEGITEIHEWAFYQSSLESVEIPDSVVKIGIGAFCQSKLKKVDLPDGIEVISRRTFDDCNNLTEVRLPQNLKRINGQAFNMTGLTAIDFPDGFEKISGYGVFSETNITTLTLPDSVTEIGPSAFRECSKLKKVQLSNNLEIIGNNAFFSCRNLQSLDIPKSVTDIGEYAFFDCRSIKEMTIQGNIKEIKKMTFSGCRAMTKINYPDSVTKIGYSAFSNTGFKTLPITKYIKSIGESAFSNNNITSIKVPEGVKTIGNNAFGQCLNLKTVYIPKSVTSIGSEAFGQCENLEKLTISNPLCKVYTNETDNIFFKGSKIYMLEKVKLYGYKGSTAEELSKVLNVKFVSIDKTAMDYPELKNKKEPKVVTGKDSYTVAMDKEIKIPYKVTNGNGYTVKVTGGTEYIDGIGYDVVKVVKITDDYIIIKGLKWTGTVTLKIKVGFTTKAVKVTVK